MFTEPLRRASICLSIVTENHMAKGTVGGRAVRRRGMSVTHDLIRQVRELAAGRNLTQEQIAHRVGSSPITVGRIVHAKFSLTTYRREMLARYAQEGRQTVVAPVGKTKKPAATGDKPKTVWVNGWTNKKGEVVPGFWRSNRAPIKFGKRKPVATQGHVRMLRRKGDCIEQTVPHTVSIVPDRGFWGNIKRYIKLESDGALYHGKTIYGPWFPAKD